MISLILHAIYCSVCHVIDLFEWAYHVFEMIRDCAHGHNKQKHARMQTHPKGHYAAKMTAMDEWPLEMMKTMNSGLGSTMFAQISVNASVAQGGEDEFRNGKVIKVCRCVHTSAILIISLTIVWGVMCVSLSHACSASGSQGLCLHALARMTMISPSLLRRCSYDPYSAPQAF